jgi:putative ABC transport system permease protein
MIKHYFKQTRNLMRQEKLFSVIYILGTGLSVTVVMALSIVFYIRIANIYPETNRDRMLIISRGIERNGNGYSSGTISYTFIRDHLKTLKSVEAVSAVARTGRGASHYVQPEDHRKPIAVKIIYTDAAFWTVFNFRFREGKPFTGADVESGIATVVIARSLARKLFGEGEGKEAEAVGRYLKLDASPFRICGVVDDASWATKNSYAQVWAPYSVKPEFLESWGDTGYMGDMEAFILVPSAADVGKVKQEITDNFRRYASQFDDKKPELTGQPDRHWQNAFRDDDRSVDFSRILAVYGLIFLILLIVPAISLSGMADSRMERRLAEMGVRRAFGARASMLMRQVLFENFLFTLLGGSAGLLFSYVLVIMSSRWLIGIGNGFTSLPPEGADAIISPTMLLNLPVFGVTLLVCFLLNLLSALIPAWRASRHQIIDSLNVK